MAESETITDARGRELEVRKLSRKESMSLMRKWGTACNVDIWVGNAVVAAHVRAIDGVPVPLPQSPDAVESLVDRLDDSLTDVATWLQAQPAVDPAAVRDAAKN